ncbi:MAG: EscU/YscU/HrcU family type III secretion system export apparatus switch protein [Burkholderiaceae bacterium]
MSDSSGEKTEEPTPKKLRDAVKKGEVAKSAELSGSLSMLAALLCVLSMVGYSTRKLADLSLAVDRAFESLIPSTVLNLALESLKLLFNLSLLPLLVAAGVYTFSLWLQTGTIFSLDPVKPKIENLNPVQGLKKLFSMKSLVSFALMLLKTCIVGFAVFLVCRQILPDAIRAIHFDVGSALVVVRTALVHLLLWCGSVFVFLGVADFAYQKWQFLKDHRMSMSEVRREHKEDEGDPHIKAERKRMSSEEVAQDALEYIHLASLIVRDNESRLVVIIHRPKQFDFPLFLLRASGVDACKEVLSAARKHRPKMVTDPNLLARLFPVTVTGAPLNTELSKPVLQHLNVQAG